MTAPPQAAEADYNRAEQDEAQGPSTYDPVLVGEIAKRVDIRDVQLVHAHFDREDDGATPADEPNPRSIEPEIVVDIEWSLSESGDTLHYLVRFGASVESAPAFRVYAFFRLTYELADGDPPTEPHLEQFGHWNAAFNAWPYFREYVSSTANRAGLPRLVLPVMRVPRRD